MLVRDPVRLEFMSVQLTLCAPDSKDLIADEISRGTFEQPMPAVFMALARTLGGTMLDIGANNGVYSIVACLSNAAITSIAFEPYPPVIEVLERNIALNKLEGRISIRKCALSDTDGEAPLFVPDQGHGLLETSCSLDAGFKDAVGGIVSVETKRLDDLDLPPATLIKLDVEGHEAAVLAGGRKYIAATKPILFVEVLRAADTRLVNDIAEQSGFRRYRLRHDGVVVREATVAFDLHAWNHVLVPAERAQVFEQAISGAAIPTAFDGLASYAAHPGPALRGAAARAGRMLRRVLAWTASQPRLRSGPR